MIQSLLSKFYKFHTFCQSFEWLKIVHMISLCYVSDLHCCCRVKKGVSYKVLGIRLHTIFSSISNQARIYFDYLLKYYVWCHFLLYFLAYYYQFHHLCYSQKNSHFNLYLTYTNHII